MPSRPTHSRGKERLVFIETFLGPRKAIMVIYGNDVIFITLKHANKRPNARSKVIEYSTKKQTSCIVTPASCTLSLSAAMPDGSS